MAKGLLTQKQWDEVAALTLAIFARGKEIAAKNGLILVDTKFEFGLDGAGKIVLADEILTPDSSRYWKASNYAARHDSGQEPESLDKEFLRLWIAARCDPYKQPIPEIPADTLVEFAEKYIALYETVTGRSFAAPPAGEAVKDRIRRNLAKFFG